MGSLGAAVVGSWEAAVGILERQHGAAGCEGCASCILWRGSMVLQAVRAVQVVSCGFGVRSPVLAYASSSL